MTWNTKYLTTPTPVGNYQGSAATAVFSGISLSAPLQGQIASSSAISGGAITATTIDGTAITASTDVTAQNGTAINPGYNFASEASLGVYRSAASRLALSYGQLDIPDGTAILPATAFRSEVSLGFYRSAASRIALSHGELDLINGAATQPSFGFRSEASLGLFRSANSTMALSYGNLKLPNALSIVSVPLAASLPSAASAAGYLYVDSTSSLWWVNGSGVSTLVA